MVAIETVRKVTSSSLKCRRIASCASSDTRRPANCVSVSAQVRAAHSFSVKMPASSHVATRSSFSCGTPILRETLRWICRQKAQLLICETRSFTSSTICLSMPDSSACLPMSISARWAAGAIRAKAS